MLSHTGWASVRIRIHRCSSMFFCLWIWPPSWKTGVSISAPLQLMELAAFLPIMGEVRLLIYQHLKAQTYGESISTCGSAFIHSFGFWFWYSTTLHTYIPHFRRKFLASDRHAVWRILHFRHAYFNSDAPTLDNRRLRRTHTQADLRGLPVLCLVILSSFLLCYRLYLSVLWRGCVMPFS